MLIVAKEKGACRTVTAGWQTGKPVTCDWDTGEVWAGDAPLKRHCWQHNYYFMAGDNVLDSNDSRYWGLVPEEYVVGVVGYVYKNNTLC